MTEDEFKRRLMDALGLQWYDIAYGNDEEHTQFEDAVGPSMAKAIDAADALSIVRALEATRKAK